MPIPLPPITRRHWLIGGIDPKGRAIVTLPESDGEDSGDWGKLPDSF